MRLQRDQPHEWGAEDRVIGPLPDPEARPNGISTAQRKLSGMRPGHVWRPDQRRIGRDTRPDIVGHENHERKR